MAPTQKIRWKMWSLLIEALIYLLDEVDGKVNDVIVNHIAMKSEHLHEIAKKKKNKNASFNCIRDVPTTLMKGQTKEKLGALRTSFDVVISDVLTKYKVLIKNAKKLQEDEQFQVILVAKWDKTKLLNAFAPSKVELDEFDEMMEIDDSEDEKEEKRLNLKKRISQLQKVVNEHSHSLKEKEDQETRTKKKAAEHLKKALSSGGKDEPAITTNNVYQQTIQAEKSKDHNFQSLLQQQIKQEKNVESTEYNDELA